MNITIKFSKSANTIPELGSVVRSLEAADEVYRFLGLEDKYSVRGTVDFRRKPLRHTPGARVTTFRLTTPPEISIQADNLWLAVLIWSVTNYSDTKRNFKEISEDLNSVKNLVIGFSDDTWVEIEAGIKLLADRLSETSEKNRSRIERKIASAKTWLNSDSIEKVLRSRWSGKD